MRFPTRVATRAIWQIDCLGTGSSQTRSVGVFPVNLDDRRAIATRIRGLIAGQDNDLDDAAGRLGVTGLALRTSTDDLAPQPTFDVVLALVRAYGVDPHWLTTGEYDGATHRLALLRLEQ
jgi:hypothetical protein